MSVLRLNQYRRSRTPNLVSLVPYLNNELITNGDFATGDLTGWSATAPTTIAYNSGTCRVSRNSAAYGTDMCYQDINLEIGNYYLLKYQFTYQSSTSTYLDPSPSWDGGASENAIYAHKDLNTYYYLLLAIGNSLRLIFKVSNNATGVVGFDNVSLKRIIYSS
jgi:hypothetical protein